MKLFTTLYQKTLELAKHRFAERYLAIVSFAESSFFPIPPDIMLLPMVVAKPQRWRWLAFLTTLSSVLGGVFGYLIGYFAFDGLEPILIARGYEEKLRLAESWFQSWGIWIVFLAGFSPIPYKLFTIMAGALSMAFLPFVVASFVGRGARFFLVSGLTAWLGPKIEPYVLRYVEWIGWALIAALLIFMLISQV